METKFTKNLISTKPFNSIGFVYVDNIENPKSGTVATCYIDNFSIKEENAIANAKLFAAAPDLFDELIKILPYIENFPKFQQESIKKAIEKAIL